MAKFDRVTFVGDGLYRVPGVPMRDMTGDEWYALELELRERATHAGLYEGVHGTPAKAVEPAPKRSARTPRKAADRLEVATVATEDGPEIVPAEVAEAYDEPVAPGEGEG